MYKLKGATAMKECQARHSFVMFRLPFTIILGTAIAVTLGQSQSGVTEEKILGGKKIPIEEAPFMVQVDTNIPTQKNNFGYCGGSLVTLNHVLTAAHCTLGNVEDMRVYVGSEDFALTFLSNNTAVEYRVKSYQKHPQYNGNLKWSWGKYAVNDVSVIRLATSVKLGPKVATIRIVEPNQQPPADVKMTVSGWGVYKATTFDVSNTLRSTSLTVLTADECRKEIKEAYTPKEICLKSSQRGSMCYGDSGAPSYIGQLQYGVASWMNCGQGAPSVYVNLADPSVNSFVKKMVATL